MNLKVLLLLLIYYSVLSLVFLMGAEAFADYDSNIDLNSSGLSSSEIDQGGFFGTGISFSRFFTLVAFGIGLPTGTPVWFSILFIMFQSVMTIFSAGFVISSIWNG